MNERKRYSLAIPHELYNEVARLAKKRDTTVLDMLRRFIKLGLIAVAVEDNPDAALIIREGNKEREIVLL